MLDQYVILVPQSLTTYTLITFAFLEILFLPRTRNNVLEWEPPSRNPITSTHVTLLAQGACLLCLVAQFLWVKCTIWQLRSIVSFFANRRALWWCWWWCMHIVIFSSSLPLHPKARQAGKQSVPMPTRAQRHAAMNECNMWPPVAVETTCNQYFNKFALPKISLKTNKPRRVHTFSVTVRGDFFLAHIRDTLPLTWALSKNPVEGWKGKLICDLAAPISSWCNDFEY